MRALRQSCAWSILLPLVPKGITPLDRTLNKDTGGPIRKAPQAGNRRRVSGLKRGSSAPSCRATGRAPGVVPRKPEALAQELLQEVVREEKGRKGSTL